MERKDISAKKSVCILIIVVVLIAGNSSVVYGGLFKNAPPKFVENIGKVRVGMTIQEVKNLLGNPNNISTAINSNGDVSENWSYGGTSYDNLDNLGNPIMSHIVGQAALGGIGAIISQLPMGALVGLGGQVTGTGMGIAHQIATDAVTPELENYYAAVSFVNGVVTSKNYNFQGQSVTERMQRTTSSKIPHKEEMPDYKKNAVVVPVGETIETIKENIPEVVRVSTSQERGLAKEGYAFGIPNSSTLHSSKYCPYVLGKKYSEVKINRHNVENCKPAFEE